MNVNYQSNSYIVIKFLVPFVLLFFIHNGESFAETAYSNLGGDEPGDTFASNSHYSIGALSGLPGTNVHRAYSFTSAATGVLSRLDVGIGIQMDGIVAPDTMEWNLWSSDGTDPLTILWTGNVTPTSFGSAPMIVQNVSITGTAPTLVAGTEYWLSTRSSEAVATDGYKWAFNKNGFALLASGRFDNAGGTNWTNDTWVEPAFSISVSAVPEPGSLFLLLAFGAVGISARRRP